VLNTRDKIGDWDRRRPLLLACPANTHGDTISLRLARTDDRQIRHFHEVPLSHAVLQRLGARVEMRANTSSPQSIIDGRRN
jgi:hypothetical protein